MARAVAITCFAVSREDLEEVPTMAIIPKMYNCRIGKNKRRANAVSAIHVSQIRRRIHGSQEAMEQCVRLRDDENMSNYVSRMAARRRGQRPRRPVSSQYLLETPSSQYEWLTSTSMLPLIHGK